ncbi:hypothetical protein OROMI_031460 [Orobanche minor]
MALSHLRSKALYHGRSLSLPCKLHPAISQLNENLSKIRLSSSSYYYYSLMSSMDNKLNSLKCLYRNIDDLLMLPHIQHTISRRSRQKWADQVLDGYIRLMDACTTAKDLFSHSKHDARQLLSALRRKDAAQGIQAYHSSRKFSKKITRKALRDLMKSSTGTTPINKNNLSLALRDHQETIPEVVYMIKEAESVTIAMFESLLSCVDIGNNNNKEQARWRGGWSLLVSRKKLIISKKVSHNSDHQSEETCLRRHLEEMDSSIEVVEEELECLFRQLIKTRVFILNILNH